MQVQWTFYYYLNILDNYMSPECSAAFVVSRIDPVGNMRKV